MQPYEQAVFISYAWSGEREEIVNQIDQTLQERGLKIVRDKRDLGYKGFISEFMERIGQGNCVIVVVSDKYLRSENCMFELVEIAENKQFQDRIFPVVLADADIYKPIKQIQYVRYWEQQIKELKEGIQGVDPTNLQGIYEKLNLYDRIRDNISNLIAILSDMNTLTPAMHHDSDFSTLYEAVVKRMQDAAATSKNSMPDADSHPKGKSAAKKERKSMDPITLATAVTTLLAPYMSKVGEKALEKIGEQLPEKIGNVWNAISNRFKDKPDVAEAANELAKDAENTDNQIYFKMQLKKALEKDEGFASLLTDLLETAKSETGISNVNMVEATDGGFAIGRDNQINNNTGSTISVGNIQQGSKKRK